MFKSSDEIYEYYATYGKKNGFAVSKKNCKKGGDGEKKYITLACTRAGKAIIKTSNPVKLRPQTRTGCKACINAILQPDGMWLLRSLVLEHNHKMSPTESRFFKQNRILEPHVKRRLELNDRAGIRMNKNFTSLVLEAGGREKLSYLEKDCRNHIDKVHRLRLEEGDATAMYNYFVKMQGDNSVWASNCSAHEKKDSSNARQPEARRNDKMFNVFNEVADLATSCDNRCDKVVEQLRELKGELKEEVDVVSGSNKFDSMSTQNASSSYGDGVLNSKESTTILDPIVQSEFSAPSHMGFVDLGTQESIKINESEMLAPSFGQQNMLQGHLSSQGHHHPSQSWMLGNSSFAKMLNDMAQSQSENPERDKDERS
ncbi:hypothetical protein ACSBR2_007229 [Camellia fascicularis]